MQRIAMTLVLVALVASGVRAEEPAREPSPIEQAERVIHDLEAHGKDVAELKTALAALRPEWDAVQAARTEMEAKVDAFRKKFEPLMAKVQKAGGGGDPVQDVGQALARLKSGGRDTAALEKELESLRPEWEQIRAEMKTLEGLDPAARREGEPKLRARVEQFRPRMEALAQEVQKLAAVPPAR